MTNCTKEPKGILGRWFRRRTLRKQIRTIGRDLVQKLGKKRSYSTTEIEQAWHHRRHPLDDRCYAMAAYSSPSDFQDYHIGQREDCDYQAMRREIAHTCFDGRTEFSVVDLWNMADRTHHSGGGESSGWFFSDGVDFTGDSGSDSGGDSGGGGRD
jgi:uncharacterized membrane protein YgcG